jgi:translation elongation factor EF-Tu-like GTPase
MEMPSTPEELGYLEAELTLVPAKDGGRTTPIRSGYRPNWWLLVGGNRLNAGGTVELVEAEELAPGGTAAIRIYPFVPETWEPITVGSRLEMNEGPWLVGRAVVSRIVPAFATAHQT